MANVTLTTEAGVATVTLNRPECRNAMSLELLGDLENALQRLKGDAAVDVVVIAGAGPVFSAGHDLAEMLDRESGFYESLFAACTDVMMTIQAMRQPVIAKVHGIATAAGCQLVAACDLAVAAAGTRFATPGVRIGLFCSTPAVPLSRNMGRKQALHMLLTGDFISARTAQSYGLVNEVVQAPELEQATADLADERAQAQAADTAINEHFEKGAELFGRLATDYRAFIEHFVASADALGLPRGQVETILGSVDTPLLERDRAEAIEVEMPGDQTAVGDAVTDEVAQERTVGSEPGDDDAAEPVAEAASARLASDYGIPCQVALEEFMACGVGGCAGCTVEIYTPEGPRMKRVCVDGPVFDAQAVNWEATP